MLLLLLLLLLLLFYVLVENVVVVTIAAMTVAVDVVGFFTLSLGSTSLGDRHFLIVSVCTSVCASVRID